MAQAADLVLRLANQHGNLGIVQMLQIMQYDDFAHQRRETVQSIEHLIHFLGILSINLAVLNFLPIPPLDGGQMVFLLAEKVRGRPLPDSALIAGTYAGLLFVLGLMAFVIFQDVSRIVLRNF